MLNIAELAVSNIDLDQVGMFVLKKGGAALRQAGHAYAKRKVCSKVENPYGRAALGCIGPFVPPEKKTKTATKKKPHPSIAVNEQKFGTQKKPRKPQKKKGRRRKKKTPHQFVGPVHIPPLPASDDPFSLTNLLGGPPGLDRPD